MSRNGGGRDGTGRAARFRVLCVAGTDSAGCAGAAADLRTVAALGGHGLLAVTAVTAQDGRGLRALAAVSARVITAQLEAALRGVGADAVKIGMLGGAAAVRAVAAALERARPANVVLDPVLAATGGGALLDDAGRRALLARLLPLADLVTPNIPEAAALLGRRVAGLAGMASAARALVALGARAALVKGGHRRGEAADVLVWSGGTLVLRAPRLKRPDARGTGCVLSTAIACELARGAALPDAVRRGKRFVTAAIRASYPLGAAPGPADPLAAARVARTRAGSGA